MITFQNVSKTYPNGAQGLRNVSLTIEEGDFVALIGSSGAGKSTLLRTINGLNAITTGEVLVDGHSITHTKGRRLRELRGRIGMIFQSFNLVGVSTVQRNVIAGRLAHNPTWRGILGVMRKHDYQLVDQALERVGLTEKKFIRSDQLSGGQQQRVAVARALVQQPSVLLADEPVASLDPVSTDRIMSDLLGISNQLGITVVMSLHSVAIALNYATRIVGMRDGQIVFDGSPQEATETRLREVYGDEYVTLVESGQE